VSLQAGAELTLAIEKAVAGGRMLARHNGQVVLVAGTLPGERVRARIESVSRHVAFAAAIEVLEASGDRRDNDLDAACGGSVYNHIQYTRQLQLKSSLVADAFGRIGKLTLAQQVPVMPSREDGYRMRARLHIRGGRVGFFREGSHDLCDAGATRQLLPSTTDALRQLESNLPSLGGKAEACELVENVQGTERSIQIEFDNHPPTILGASHVIDHVELRSASVSLHHGVRSFFQSNRWLLKDLVERVTVQVPPGPLCDLYAGVGLFAISLAALGGSGIDAVEGDHYSATDLEMNAKAYEGRVSVKRMPVEQYLNGRIAVEAMVLDPPRSGVSPAAMSGIVKAKPGRIVYLSCDPATLARDARRLVDASYRLHHVEAFDLFPNTAHVETLAVFLRT